MATARSCAKLYSSSTMAASIASSTLISGASSSGFQRCDSPTPTCTRIDRSSSGSVSTPATAFRFAPSANPAARPVQQQKRMCMCSPSTHRGAFRCSLHRNSRPQTATTRPPTATNSVVPVSAIQRYVAKRALTSLVRSSSNRQQRRADFKPRPSRLSVMTKAEDLP